MPTERPTRLAERRSGPAQLYDGIPAHLAAALADWAAYYLGALPGETKLPPGFRLVDNEEDNREQRLKRVLVRAHIAVPPQRDHWLFDSVARMIDGTGGLGMMNDDDVLEVINMHLQVCGGGAKDLAELLDAANSNWTVGANPPRLLHRVTDEQQAQFKDAVAGGDSAGDLLSRAWEKTYGRHPDPTAAWSDAIKAVEVLLAPVVAPNDIRPQLGKMIGYIAQAPHKWTTTLRQEKVAVLDAFVDMLRVLYRNPGRHGADVATQAEAEAAVGLAVLIATWIRGGAFRRADPPPGPVSP